MSVRNTTAAVAAALGLALLTASATGALAAAIKGGSEIASLRADITAFETATTQAQNLAEKTSAQLTEITLTHDANEALLIERANFVAAVASAAAAFTSASGKVDVAAHHAAVIVAQDAVLTEKVDAAVVASQTTVVNGIAAQVTADVAAFDEQAARSSSAGRSTGGASSSGGNAGVGWFEDFRQRLNDVGGGHIALVEYDGWCGSQFAAACSFMDGTIKVHSSIADMSSGARSWAAAHEYAHQVHFVYWFQVNNSPGYQQLFGSNPETLANCMAASAGYGNRGQHCSGEMLDWAGGIWGGHIAW